MKFVPSLILLSALTCLCLHHRHGAYADLTCPKNCRPYGDKVPCNKTTGRCLEGCNTGYYGNTCDCTCHCGGGTCVQEDGTCMQTSSVKPVSVYPVHQTLYCDTTLSIVIICILVAVFIQIAVMFFWIIQAKGCRLRRKERRTPKEKPEGNQLLTTNDQSQPSQFKLPDSPQTMSQSEKKQLIHYLGVHVLYHPHKPNEPVFLFCINIRYDFRRVNTLATHLTRERLLVNKPDKDSKFQERFKVFKGTTSLSPTIYVEIPTYWELRSHVKIYKQLDQNDMLLCIGFCGENIRNKDEWPNLPLEINCISLNIGFCPEDEKICTKIYQDNESDPKCHVMANIINDVDKRSRLEYGVLVFKDKGTIMYFDLSKMKCIAILKNVDFKIPLWPMFAVFGSTYSKVSMKLITRREVDMSQTKKEMLLSALSTL